MRGGGGDYGGNAGIDIVEKVAWGNVADAGFRGGFSFGGSTRRSAAVSVAGRSGGGGMEFGEKVAGRRAGAKFGGREYFAGSWWGSGSGGGMEVIKDVADDGGDGWVLDAGEDFKDGGDVFLFFGVGHLVVLLLV